MRRFLLAFVLLVSGCAANVAHRAEQFDASAEEIEYIRSHDLPAYVERAIERGQVVPGMSPEEVLFIKGEPESKHEEGETVTWLYGPTTRRERVVFRDSTVAEMPR